MSKLLIEKGYEVYGLIRGQHNPKQKALEAELPSLKLVDGDLLDQSSLIQALNSVQPDEVYNLAAISFVPLSWTQPSLVSEVTGMGALRMLEAIRTVNKNIKFFQAGSCEQYGDVLAIPQDEQTPFNPRSPYGVAKVSAFYTTKVYRESWGLFAASAISFNHESERRGLEFVTRKITATIARIKHGKEQFLYLGNLDARRDWGYAPEFCEAFWRILQHSEPVDFVIATGETHSVGEFVDEAFRLAEMVPTGHLALDPALIRPAEVDLLVGNAAKAKSLLGWEPKVKFKDLVKIMLDADLERVEHGLL